MDFSVILASLPQYFAGLITTLWLTLVSLAIGLVIALPLSVLRTARNPFVYGPVWLYTYVFRGTPLFVQLLLIYYGSGQFEWIKDSFAWPALREAWFCALLAFALNTGAYTTEILAGAIRATPHGELEAAKACGMSQALMFRRIVLPSALRRSLPAYGNESVFMLHGSAVASQVTLLDLTGVAAIVYTRYYTPYEAFLTAAAFYMLLTLGVVGLFHLLERRFLRHLRARES